MTADERWLAIKIARLPLYQQLPLKDATGHPFQYALPAPALEMLHGIDRDASGSIRASDQVVNPQTRDTYLIASLSEEAITSSQLEGASTTRQVAKEMLKVGRAPRDRSEQMILNNYDAMQFVRRMASEELTPAIVYELQKLLTAGTLDVPDAAGRLRRADEAVVVSDEIGTVLHVPPPAEQLQRRLAEMCAFANAQSSATFIHPLVRAIALHFWLAYDHPFVDGNGRTARALFYWSVARDGYWLCEYLSISRLLRKARGKYARSFLYVETDDNDFTYFLLAQLQILTRAIEALHGYLARKQAELDRTAELMRRSLRRRTDFNPRQLALLNHAIKNPDAVYTLESHRRSHNVSYETARSDLLVLTERRLLMQSKRGRAFIFSPAQNLRRLVEAL
jgi:Fic family protein